jgi:phosphatidylserine/phosphatidylglycerophosphate/cardiolipin synthase-like enzyme
MLIIDEAIIKVLTAQLDAVRFDLKIIMYSISPASKSSHKAVKLYWQELQAAIARCKNAQIILSAWPEENPQASATKNATIQLTAAGASVKLGKIGTITHPKSWLFDDKNLLIGSHNATAAGLLTTKNLSIITSEQQPITDYKAYFDSLWQNLQTLKS